MNIYVTCKSILGDLKFVTNSFVIAVIAINEVECAMNQIYRMEERPMYKVSGFDI